mgnify:CR=1 FL=1
MPSACCQLTIVSHIWAQPLAWSLRDVVCCGAVWCGAAALSVALWCEAAHVAGAMRCDVVRCRKSGAVMGSMWWPGGAGSSVAAVAGPCA